MKAVLALLVLFSLSACAPPLSSGDMLPMTHIYSQLPPNDTLERSITLGKVSVFENAGGLGAPVTVDSYQEALANALLTSGMAARDGEQASYVLDAELVALDLPLVGFNLTVDSKATYTLRHIHTQEVVVNETVSIPYTANFSESFDGTQRMRIAAAKAIRENITHLLRVLASKTKDELSGKGTSS